MKPLSLILHSSMNLRLTKSLSPLLKTNLFSKKVQGFSAIKPHLLNQARSFAGIQNSLRGHEHIGSSIKNSFRNHLFRGTLISHGPLMFPSVLNSIHLLDAFHSKPHSFRFACLSSTSNVQDDLIHIVEVGWDEMLNSREGLEELAEQLQEDGKLALKEAISKMEVAQGANAVELSVLLTSDSEIQTMNKQWRDEDKPTDVLSFQQDQPPGFNPTLLLGDVVISMDTAERQAQLMKHSLMDELRILMLHGLLHILGYDHENGEEGEREMKEEEKRIISLLGWKGQGLIENAYANDKKEETRNHDQKKEGKGEGEEGKGGKEEESEGEKEGEKEENSRIKSVNEKEKESKIVGAKKLPFRFLFCDMDGTLLNSQSKISLTNARALKEASAMGVQIIIATGKTRPAAFAALSSVGLVGEGNILSKKSPGVFLQGLRVYGKEGTIVHNSLLPEDVCTEGFSFSLKHDIALIGFSGDECVTLFDHPLVQNLHTTYYEPRAVVMPSIEEILLRTPIHKLLFYDSVEKISEFVRPHWSLVSMGRASITQAVPDMIEILPPGASKGLGVKILLEHLNASPEEVMALGDGENDLEMLEMAGWGVAMANGSHKTKSVANAIVSSNDEDGVAEAIQRFLFNN